MQIGLIGFIYNMMGICSSLGIIYFMKNCKGNKKYFDKLIKISVSVCFIFLIIFGFTA